jgi:hypothetical protein
MLEPSRWILRNASRRPVELHLSSGVQVLHPGERIELSGSEPHCRALEKQGVLTRHKSVPAHPEERAKRTPPKPGKKATATSTSKRRPSATSPKGATKAGGKKGRKESTKSKSQSGKKRSPEGHDGEFA